MKQTDAAKGTKKWIETLVFTSLILVPLAGIAQIFWTNTAGGNWNVAANWNPNTVPGSNDSANISMTGTYTVTNTTGATVNTLTLGASKGSQTLLITDPAVLPITFTVSGSALVDTRGILTCGSNVTVKFSSNATVAGTIQPLAGQVVFNQAFILSSNSVLQFSIGGTNAGSQYGTIAVASSTPTLPTLGAPGSVRLAGTLKVNLTTNFAPNAGDTFPLMSFALKQGGFDAAVLGSLSNGMFIQMQVPTDRKSLLAVIKTTNAPSVPAQTNMADLTVAGGDTAVFSPPASGVVPFTCQWRFNGTNLAGRTNVTLIITNAQTNDTGNYCVTVADALLQTNTWCAALSVLSPPYFTAQPLSQTVSNGGTVTLSVTVSCPSPLQYQWRRNAVNVSGAAGPTFTITTNVQAWDGGAYDVLVSMLDPLLSRPVSTIVSSAAVVNVVSPPLPFAGFPGGYTNGFSFVGSGDNTGATNQPGDPPIEGNPASHRLYLQWTAPANGDGVMMLDTVGSTFDTVLGVFTGFDLTNLTLVASDDDSGKSLASRVFFPAQAGTTYVVAVDGFAGATGNVVLSGMFNTNLSRIPELSQQPQGVAVQPGGTATFSVSASNTANLSYQWYQGDWLKIHGATNSTLTISNVNQMSMDFSATVTGTNGQGVDSRRATLEIGPALSFGKLGSLLQQLNQTNGGNFSFLKFMALASSASFPSVSAGTIGSQLINNFNSTTAQGEPATVHGIGGSTRWYLLTAATNGTMVIDTMGSDIATLLSVYTGGDIFSLQLVASDRNSAPDGTHSLVRYAAIAGTNYLIEVDGVNGAQGNIYVNWRMGIPPNTVGPAQNLAVTNGSSLQLQAGENGNVTSPTYQWQLNGVNIPGATNANYTNSNIQYNQCGSYSVVVSNLVGVVTNAIALVTVDSPLKIASVIPAHISGSATQTTVLQLSTNLASWKPLYTNQTSLLPVNYLDTGSTNRDKGFYRLKRWP